MTRRLLPLAGLAIAAMTGAAQAQDSSTTVRFGVTSVPNRFGSGFTGDAGYPDRQNPMYQSPFADRANATDPGKGPQLGPEGGGTPMSRGGINDTLLAPNPAATFNAPHAAPRPKPVKEADKSRTPAQDRKAKP